MDSRLRVNYPPDPNPRKPKFKAPPKTCDTHFHVYGPPHLYPYVDKRRYTPPAAPLEHYLAMAAILGIERGVLVHPNVHGFENRMTLDSIARSDGRLRGMIRANPDLGPADLKSLHAAGVRGVRFNLVKTLGGAFDRKGFETIVSRLAPLGWPVCLHIDAELLEPSADMIRRVPLPVIIDHFGRCDARDGIDHPHFRTLLDLIGEANVHVKIACADRQITRGATLAQVADLAHALIARAPERIVWGTDWPHSMVFEPGKMPNDGDLMDMVPVFAPDEAVRNRILVETPAKLFDFP
jgi:predicted TIM-barrel fold metal-dependent hydrolase